MKSIFLLLMILGLARPLWAQTDDKTAQFLKKLNLSYYCPSREGLKGFTCDLTVSVSEVYKKDLMGLGVDAKLAKALDGQKLTLSVTADGQYTLDTVTPKPSGDAHFDSELNLQLAHIRKDLQSVIETWVNDVFEPGFDGDSFNNDFTVVNGPNGFTVEEKIIQDGSLLKMDYGPKSRLEKMTVIKNGAILLIMNLSYSLQPKGYQMDSYSGDVPKMNLRESDTFTYGSVGGYRLPLRIVKEVQLPPTLQKGASITCDFSNYSLSQ